MLDVLTARWRGRKGVEFRRWWLLRHPLCNDCERQGVVRAAVEVDHIVPLWNKGTNHVSNFQSLCKDCHEAKTQKEIGERVGRKATGVDGWPVNR